MDCKVEIELCMGSSCFARGSNLLLEMLEDLIKDRGWEDCVVLSGLRCQGKCGEGPNLKIDGKLCPGLDEGALLDILEAKLGGTDVPARTSVRRSAAIKTSDRKGR